MTTRNALRSTALTAVALSALLGLSACGDTGTESAGGGASSGQHGSGHGGGHSDGSSAAKAGDADIAFLAGMVPHHAQAVEMSEIVLEKDPPAEVAALARQIKDAQAPEIEQMERMLTDLGTSPGEHSEHAGGHGGMMSEQEMAELEDATGTEAARLYLEKMIAHHQGAIEASEKEIAEGRHEPAKALAREIARAQAAEIATMRQLLARL